MLISSRLVKLSHTLTPAELIFHAKKKYVLGDPTKPETSLGPVVSVASAERIRKQVADAGEDHVVSLPSRYLDQVFM